MNQTTSEVSAPFINNAVANMTDTPLLEEGMNNTVWWQLFSPLRRTGQYIFVTGAPLILVLGIFGNVAITLIMWRFSGSTLAVFFQVLAWSDQLLLTTGLLPNILGLAFGVLMIEDLGSWPCKVYKVVIYTAGAVSPWMLVALTMQRAASVLWPHRVNAVWTKRKSRIVAGSIVSFFTLSHCHFMYGWGYDAEKCWSYTLKCCPVAVSDTYAWFFNVVWPWIDFAEFSLLPFVLLVISNSILVWKLATSLRAGSDHRLAVQQTTLESRHKKVSSMTVTLLTVSASFFLLTTPASVYFIVQPLVVTPEVFYHNPVLVGQYLIFFDVAHLLWYANSAINFYLYVLTGTKFRAEFLSVMREMLQFCCRVRTQKKTEEEHHGGERSKADTIENEF